MVTGIWVLPAAGQSANPYGTLPQELPEGSVPFIPGPGYGNPDDREVQSSVDVMCQQMWYDCRLKCQRETDVYSEERSECYSRCGRERLRCEGF